MTWKELPGADPPEPRPVAESLDRVASSLGVSRATTLAVVFGSWPDLVGDAVASRARPRSLREGVLVVAVEEPAWATQLRWLEADLLRRLADVVGPGAVTSVEVRVEPR